MKIVTILGTRPEIIKLSPLIPLLDKGFEHVVVHTGQHYSYGMDKIFFDDLKLRNPDYRLDINAKTNVKQVAKIMEGLEDIFVKENPDLVIVHGDTNTTLAGGLSAVKSHIKLAHVESGCRSFNRKMQEEINRVVVDHCADILFAPTKNCKNNLLKEGIDKRRIHLVGNTSIDACNRNIKIAEEKSSVCKKLNLNEFILVTCHRAENVDDREKLRGIVDGINQLSEKITVVFPVHPRTEKRLKEFSIKLHKNIVKIEPTSYLDFLTLLKHAKVVLTDSGGVQEEACVLKTPCLTIRDETEWVETVEAGANRVIGRNTKNLVKYTTRLLKNPPTVNCPFKEGATERICSILAKEGV